MGEGAQPGQPLPLAVRERRLVNAVRRTFGSLDTYNYRLFFTGDLISHVGGARPNARTVTATAVLLGIALLVAAATLPSELWFGVALVPVGALAVFFGSTANGHMQMSSLPHMRGRVMAIYSLLTLGSTVVGGPFVGWVCQTWSPRAGLALAGSATLTAAVAVQLFKLRPKKSQMSFQPSLAASTR